MKKSLTSAFIVSFLLPQMLWAQSAASNNDTVTEPLAIVMIIIAVALLPLIYILGKGTILSYEVYKKKIRNKTAVLAIALLATLPAFAQETQTAVATSSGLIGGLSKSTFYLLLSVIILEVIIIAFLGRTYYLFNKLRSTQVEGVEAAQPKKRWSWLEKLNNTKSVDAKSEAEINLGHDYDGIGELDNPTPPWWQWGFIISVVFAFVYMYTHHISKTSPLQIQELAIANEKAEKQIEAYLATSAGNIDENNVTLLTDNADLTEGKEIFVAACAACHAPDGGGLVGPNLTDKYWLHGGSINDIFRTIKYGVPEKGMKSWKDDYSPKQIARIASYVHSLQGTTPADPKEPQGDLYEGPVEKGSSDDAAPAEEAK